MGLNTSLLLEHILLAAHHSKTAKHDDKLIWNKLGIVWRQLAIGLIAFVLLCTLCRRFHTLFLQDPILIIAHQRGAAEPDGNRTWNNIGMLPETPQDAIICIYVGLYPLHELVSLVRAGKWFY